jgi:hypothetical protein
MDVPIVAMSHGFPGYAITFWLIPLLYGSWRVVLLLYVAGPLLPVFFVGPNEVPAIWCLESIFLCAIIVKTPLRRWLHVDSWYALPSRAGYFQRHAKAPRSSEISKETASQLVSGTGL